MALRAKIVKLAKVIGGLPGMFNKIDENSPEYYCLACVVTDDHADIAIAAGLRKLRTADYLAKKTGKPLKEAHRLALELADMGVFGVHTRKEDGEDVFDMEIFAPGTLERMVGNKKQVEKHPQIARAFDEYTKNAAAQLSSMLPMGSNLMRVVPIERAIDGNSHGEPFEKISYYLDKYDLFSVTDCSCRVSRRLAGEGCGHLEHDICLHLGPSAEFYARTGKARYVTREEAEAIIKKAEDNGLMHDMPNIGVPGESNAICNCCSCSCFGLRVGMMFGARDAVRSNFVAAINSEKCVACGQCIEHCPGNALKMGQKLCPQTPLPQPKPLRKITENKWTQKDWNADYRENREEVLPSGTAPCKTACPAHIGVQGYIKLAAQGRYQEALALIKKENPFPAVCGRICNRQCESECTRGSLDQPVAIDEIKKFIADQELTKQGRFVPQKRNDYSDKKIAIVGSGPAGLSCAYYLALDNYNVTVFEKEEQLGGMLTLGIPSFRLEKEVVKAEIQVLYDLGVHFITGVEVGKDVTLNDLRSQGYRGFYLAPGAQTGRKLNIPGEEGEGVLSGVDFLSQVNLGKGPKFEGDAIVIGGGNVAIDVARTAIRQGARSVHLYCLENTEEMPAQPDEVAEAKKENIHIHNGWGPIQIIHGEGSLKAVQFQKCLRVLNNKGQFSPVFDHEQIITPKAHVVLVAIGQSIAWGGLLKGAKARTNPNGTIIADGFTYQTGQKDIFAGGDAYTGPKFAIDAIAAGKQGAISLHRYVQPGQSLTLGRSPRRFKALDKGNIDIGSYDHTPRQNSGHDCQRENTFQDDRKVFTEEQLKKETQRCLDCGVTQVDPYLCIGCGQCVINCKFDAISLKKQFNEKGGTFEQLPIAVAKYALKRTGKIIAKGIKG